MVSKNMRSFHFFSFLSFFPSERTCQASNAHHKRFVLFLLRTRCDLTVCSCRMISNILIIIMKKMKNSFFSFSFGFHFYFGKSCEHSIAKISAMLVLYKNCVSSIVMLKNFGKFEIRMRRAVNYLDIIDIQIFYL